MTEHHPFDADTAVVAHGSGRYGTTVSDRWGLLGPGGGFANGGYVLALCLRAAAREAGHPDPVAVSATYRSRVRFGPAELVTEPIRSGRRLSAVQVRLEQEGKERVRVVASFADLAVSSGRTDVRNAPPQLPSPDECHELAARTEVPGLTLAQRLEYRYPQLPGWRTGAPAGRLTEEFWMRFAPGPSGDERHADPLALAGLVDMATPPVLDLGEAGSTTIELSVHVRAVPAPGWLACRASTRHVMAGFHDEDFEIWDSTGQLVAQSRQLALLPSRHDHVG